MTFKTCFKAMLPLVALALPTAQGAVKGAYTPDSNTLVLYHFDELAGTGTAGRAILNHGLLGGSLGPVNALNLTKTGGPTGRNNNTAGGYGSAGSSTLGAAFNVPGSGESGVPYHANASTKGGGLTTAAGVSQSSLQGTNTAFTWEAVINVSTLGSSASLPRQVIISHDGDSTLGLNSRGPTLQITNNASTGNVAALTFYNGNGNSSGGSATIIATIPTSGTHAYSSGSWYHVAVTFSGTLGQANNVKLYWTKLASTTTTANQIGQGTLTTSQAISGNTVANTNDGGPPGAPGNNPYNYLGIGTDSRGLYRGELQGLIDEVRISDIARSPSDFLFQ